MGMTIEIALHCMKSASELERELCEECPIYGQTGCDHCFEDALQYVIGMLEQAPTTKNNLGVDLISRADVLKLMKDNWHAHNGDWAMQESMDDIRALPSVTPQEPRWIPVSERLPDTDNEVLCWYEYYHWSQEKVLPEYGLGRYFKETKAWLGEVANGKDVRVIAWMPLPEPYKADRSEE